MFIYIIIAVVFISVFLLIFSFGLPVSVSKQGGKRGLQQLSYYGVKGDKKEKTIPSFSERIIIPFLTGIASFVKRLSPKGIVESNRHRLELAGNFEKYNVDVFMALKFLVALGFLFLYIILSIFFNISLLLKIILLILIPLSYFLPDVFLRGKISSRQREIRRALPNALDLLSISVEAGMGFDTALARVSNNIKGALGNEFQRMLQDIQLGFSRRDAFHNLNKRTEVSELNSFIVAMTQAEVFGISVGKVLKVQAAEMRIRRRQIAEEAGVKAPVKLIFPLILCLFPALLTVILGPAVIRAYYTILEVIKS